MTQDQSYLPGLQRQQAVTEVQCFCLVKKLLAAPLVQCCAIWLLHFGSESQLAEGDLHHLSL